MLQVMKISLLSSTLSIVFTLLMIAPNGDAINCYTCSSWNGSDINCHDPYNPAFSVYTKDCMVAKERHTGTFPGYFCLKLIGERDTTGESLVIRACILENMDNQCGMFRFQNHYYTGCVLTCDYNGCNESADFPQPNFKSWMAATVATMLFGALISRH